MFIFMLVSLVKSSPYLPQSFVCVCGMKIFIEISYTEYKFYGNIYFKIKMILVINTCIYGKTIKEIINV